MKHAAWMFVLGAAVGAMLTVGVMLYSRASVDPVMPEGVKWSSNTQGLEVEVTAESQPILVVGKHRPGVVGDSEKLRSGFRPGSASYSWQYYEGVQLYSLKLLANATAHGVESSSPLHCIPCVIPPMPPIGFDLGMFWLDGTAVFERVAVKQLELPSGPG